MSVHFKILSGRDHVVVRFFGEDGAEWFVTRDASGIFAAAMSYGTFNLRYLQCMELSLDSARNLRDELTRAIVLAEFDEKKSAEKPAAGGPP